MAIPPASRQRYDIVVRGRLSARYDFAFDGVTLEPRHGETMLRADLAGQSQLYGLLNRLRDLGIERISVNVPVGTGNGSCAGGSSQRSALAH